MFSPWKSSWLSAAGVAIALVLVLLAELRATPQPDQVLLEFMYAASTVASLLLALGILFAVRLGLWMAHCDRVELPVAITILGILIPVVVAFALINIGPVGGAVTNLLYFLALPILVAGLVSYVSARVLGRGLSAI